MKLPVLLGIFLVLCAGFSLADVQFSPNQNLQCAVTGGVDPVCPVTQTYVLLPNTSLVRNTTVTLYTGASAHTALLNVTYFYNDSSNFTVELSTVSLTSVSFNATNPRPGVLVDKIQYRLSKSGGSTVSVFATIVDFWTSDPVPNLSITLNNSVNGSQIAGFCAAFVTGANISCTVGNGSSIISLSAQGWNSQSRSVNYATLTNSQERSGNVTRFATIGDQLCAVPPWFTQSNFCTTAYFNTGCGISSPTFNYYCLVTDELSQRCLTVSMSDNSSKETEALACHNTLVRINTSTYGTLTQWNPTYDNRTGTPSITLPSNIDNAGDSDARLLIAEFNIANNPHFSNTTLKDEARARAQRLCADFVRYNFVNTNKISNSNTSRNITKFPAGGGDAAAGGITASAFMYSGYYGDYALALLACGVDSGNTSYYDVAEDVVENLLAASNWTPSTGFKVPPGRSFHWTSGTQPSAKCDVICNPDYIDDPDGKRLTKICAAERLYRDAGLVLHPNIAEYCQEWYALITPTTYAKEWYTNGTRKSSLVDDYDANALATYLDMSQNASNIGPRLNLTGNKFVIGTQTFDSAACQGLYNPSFPIESLGYLTSNASITTFGSSGASSCSGAPTNPTTYTEGGLSIVLSSPENGTTITTSTVTFNLTVYNSNVTNSFVAGTLPQILADYNFTNSEEGWLLGTGWNFDNTSDWLFYNGSDSGADLYSPNLSLSQYTNGYNITLYFSSLNITNWKVHIENRADNTLTGDKYNLEAQNTTHQHVKHDSGSFSDTGNYAVGTPYVLMIQFNASANTTKACIVGVGCSNSEPISGTQFLGDYIAIDSGTATGNPTGTAVFNLTRITIINTGSVFPLNSSLTINLSAYFAFENNNLNSSVNAANGFSNEGTVNTTGIIGTARYANGTGASLDITSVNPVILNKSYNMWVKPNSSQTPALRTLMYSDSTDSFSDEMIAISSANIPSCTFGSGIADVASSSSKPIPNDSWSMITCVLDDDQDRLLLYVNGSLEGNVSYNYAMGNHAGSLVLFERTDGFGLNGRIDEFAIYRRPIDQREINELYNYYAGRTYSTMQNSGSANENGSMNITIRNASNNAILHQVNSTSNGTTISTSYSAGLGSNSWYVNVWSKNNREDFGNFTYTIANSSSSATYCTVGTTITHNQTGIYNITVFNVTGGHSTPAYFNVTVENYNFNSSGQSYFATLNLSTYQALLRLNATRLFLNTPISAFNASSGAMSNTTTSGTLFLKANNGSSTVSVAVAGNYTINVSCTVSNPLSTSACTATGIYDDLVTVGANYDTNGIRNFTLNVTNTSLGGVLYSVNINNGSVRVPLLQGYSYLYDLFNMTTYADINYSETTTNNSNNYNFSVYISNVFDLTFRNESTNAVITNQTIYVQILSEPRNANYTTNNGSLFIDFLVPGNYTIRYWIDEDVPREYYVTFTGQSYNNITLYIIDEDISQFYLPKVYNQNGYACEQNIVSLLRYFILGNNSGEYKVVEMAKTDSNGQAVLRVVPNTINYKLAFTGSCGSYVSAPQKITATTNSYTVTDQPTALASIIGMQGVSRALTFNNATNTFVCTWVDTSNLVTSGTMKIVKRQRASVNTSYFLETTESSIGSIAHTITDTNETVYTATCTLDTNTAFSAYPQTIVQSFLQGFRTFGLIGVFVSLLVILVIAFMGGGRVEFIVGGTVAGLFVMGLFGFMFYTWTAAVGLLIIAVIIAYKSRT